MFKAIIAMIVSLILIVAQEACGLQIESISPAQNEMNVSASSSISVRFDQALKGNTINDSTFVVYTRFTGIHSGSYYYDLLTNTVTFQPDNAFSHGDLVTVVITDQIKSIAGEALDKSFIWQFRVGVNPESPGRFVLDSVYDEGYIIFATAADFNGDLIIDFAVTAGYRDTLSVYLNDGTGRFNLSSQYHVPTMPAAIISADFDRDNDIDLAIGTHYSHDMKIMLNDGFGNFEFSGAYPSKFPYNMYAADFNGDGNIDICAGNATDDSISIYLNNGHADFSNNYACYSKSGTYDFDVADFDNDGDLDLITCNTDDSQDDLSVLLNNGEGDFQVSYERHYSDGLNSTVTGDFDSDNDIDIASGHGQYISIYLNDSTGYFIFDRHIDNEKRPFFLDAADMDGNGNMDILSQAGNDFTFLLNSVSTEFNQRLFPARKFNADVGSIADLDSDADVDLIYTSAFGFIVLLNEEYLCGDSNEDGIVNIEDIIHTVNYIFYSSVQPRPFEAGDVNCDGLMNISDVVYTINYIFLSGSAPCETTSHFGIDCLY